jgi:hypothetical protein
MLSREWARRNKHSKYFPDALLEALGFEIECPLSATVLNFGQ